MIFATLPNFTSTCLYMKYNWFFCHSISGHSSCCFDEQLCYSIESFNWCWNRQGIWNLL